MQEQAKQGQDQRWPPAGLSTTPWAGMLRTAGNAQPGEAGQGPPAPSIVLPQLAQQSRLAPDQQQQQLQRVLASSPAIQAQLARLQGSVGPGLGVSQVQATASAPQGFPRPPTSAAPSATLPPAPIAPHSISMRPPGTSIASHTAPSVHIQARPPTIAAPPRPTMRAAEIVPAARRNKKRLRPDLHIPAQLADSLGDSAFVHVLTKAEQRVDAAIASKHAHIHEAMRHPARTPKRLRLYLSNTHANQSQDASLGDPATDPPSWVLTIMPKLLDVADAEGFLAPQQLMQRASAPSGLRHLRRMRVRFLEPEHAQAPLQWEQPRGGDLPDALHIRRQGNKDVKLRISAELDDDIPRFKLAPPLAALLGKGVDSRDNVLRALASYIRTHGLQADGDPGTVCVDETLRQMLGCGDEVKLGTLSERITPLLLPQEPFTFEHTIRVSGPSPTTVEAFDIPCDIVASTGAQQTEEHPSILAAKANLDREVDVLDQQISSLLASAKEHKRRRAILTGFALSPVDLINALLAAQTRDLRQAAGGPLGGFGSSSQPPKAVCKSEHYHGEWVEDAVLRFLHRRLAFSA